MNFRINTRAGFTLFELMLVLVIMALTAAIVAPRVSPLSVRRLDATARQAFAMTRYARSIAVTGGVQARIVMQQYPGAIWLETESAPFDSPGVFTRQDDEWGRGIEMPEGVELAWIAADSVTFKPDGTASDALIVLRENGGAERTLEIRGSTGLSRVLDEEEAAYRRSRMESK